MMGLYNEYKTNKHINKHLRGNRIFKRDNGQLRVPTKRGLHSDTSDGQFLEIWIMMLDASNVE